jgi:hypothetical protein
MLVGGQGIIHVGSAVAILYLQHKTIQPAIDGGKTGVASVIMKRHCTPLNEPVRTVYQYQIPVEESRSKLSRQPRHLAASSPRDGDDDSIPKSCFKSTESTKVHPSARASRAVWGSH